VKQYTHEDIEANIGKYCYYHISDNDCSGLEQWGLYKIHRVNSYDHRYPVIIEDASSRGDLAVNEILHIFNEENKLVKLLVKESQWVSKP
jgi:hypothetical protein